MNILLFFQLNWDNQSNPLNMMDYTQVKFWVLFLIALMSAQLNFQRRRISNKNSESLMMDVAANM